MKPFRNFEKLSNLHPNWKPGHAAYVKSVQWTPGQLLICFLCHPEGKKNWDEIEEVYELTLLFRHISEVHIQLGSTQLMQIVGLDIHDISDRGLERLNYQIEDYEEGKFDFYCESIEVLDVTEPAMLMIWQPE